MRFNTLNISTSSPIKLNGKRGRPRKVPNLMETCKSVAADRDTKWGDTYKEISGAAKAVVGMDMTTEQFLAQMMLLKLMRWCRSDYKEKDCLIDLINYANMAHGFDILITRSG